MSARKGEQDTQTAQSAHHEAITVSGTRNQQFSRSNRERNNDLNGHSRNEDESAVIKKRGISHLLGFLFPWRLSARGMCAWGTGTPPAFGLSATCDASLLDIYYPAFTFVLYITSGISFGAFSPCTAKKEGRKHLIPRM